jgi:hypothetical protein
MKLLWRLDSYPMQKTPALSSAQLELDAECFDSISPQQHKNAEMITLSVSLVFNLYFLKANWF